MEDIQKMIGSEIGAREAVLTGREPRRMYSDALHQCIQEQRALMFKPLIEAIGPIADYSDDFGAMLTRAMRSCNDYRDIEHLIAYLHAKARCHQIHDEVASACHELLKEQLGVDAIEDAVLTARDLLKSLKSESEMYFHLSPRSSDEEKEKFRAQAKYLVQAIPAWMIPRKLEQGSIPATTFKETSSHLRHNEGHYTEFGEVAVEHSSLASFNWYWSTDSMQLLFDCDSLDRANIEPVNTHSDTADHPTHKGIIPSASIRAILSAPIGERSRFIQSYRSKLNKVAMMMSVTTAALKTKKIIPIVPCDSDSIGRSKNHSTYRQRMYEGIYPPIPEALRS